MYKRRFRKIRKFVRRHATYRNYNRGMKMARDLAWLKSVVNVEKKYVDASFNNTISTTHNFQLLNGLSTGTSATTRTGQSIKVVSSFVRFYMTMNASATTTQVRIIMLKDLQPNAAIPTAAQLLQDTTNVLSPLLVAYGRRFKVFIDKIFRLDTNKLNQEFKKYRKHAFHTEYNTGSTGSVSDITKNSFYIMMLSDQAVNTPTVQFWSRVRFIDN